MRAIVRPLVRFCLRRAAVLPDVLEALKQEFVLEADKILEERGSSRTISKISAMTGITRREVKRLAQGEVRIEAGQSLAARVISEWENNKLFQDSTGKPRKLLVKGGKNEFKTLVQTVSRDTDPATMLFELVRLDAARLQPDDRVELLKDIAMYDQFPERAVELLYRNMEHMLTSAEENLAGSEDTKNLFVLTEYTQISIEAFEMIRKWLLDEGQALHRKARNLISQHDDSVNSEIGTKETCRVVLSSFSLVKRE